MFSVLNRSSWLVGVLFFFQVDESIIMVAAAIYTADLIGGSDLTAVGGKCFITRLQCISFDSCTTMVS